eukprot:6387341-Amphidinium_carterae.2
MPTSATTTTTTTTTMPTTTATTTAATVTSSADPLQILKFSLVDAQANAVIAAFDPLVDGATLDLDSLPSELSLVAVAASGVSSVQFEVNGNLVRVENVAPYALGSLTRAPPPERALAASA